MSWEDFMTTVIIPNEEHTIFIKDIIISTGIAVATWITVKFLRRSLLKPNFIIDKIDQKRRVSIFLISKYLCWIISIMLVLKALHVEITGLIIGSTALLVGLGFGLQNIFKDFISGLFLLFEGTIKIGDIIEADGVVGRVTEINIRSSQLVTRDDVTIIIPNSKFIVEKVVNWSHDNESIRFTVNVGVAYGSDVEEVINCLEDTMKEEEHILLKPSPFVRFTDFGDSALQFELIFWSKETFYIDNIKSDLRRLVYSKLKENGIKIPFPQREITIKTDKLNEILTKEKVN